MEPYWPFWVYFAAVIVVAAGMLGISYVLGQRHTERETNEPYESGIPVTGTARGRLPVKFYLVAMLFVIFDVESAFIFAWAVAVRETGWRGFFEMLVFIGLLAVMLAYLWRLGALDWNTIERPEMKMEAARDRIAETTR